MVINQTIQAYQAYTVWHGELPSTISWKTRCEIDALHWSLAHREFGWKHDYIEELISTQIKVFELFADKLIQAKASNKSISKMIIAQPELPQVLQLV